MPYDPIQNGYGASALDQNIMRLFLEGYGIQTGCQATYAGSGTDIDIASGTAWYNGGRVSVSSQTVTLTQGQQNPRFDVIYLDGSGTAQVLEGTAESRDSEQSGQSGFDLYQPAPPDLASTDGVIIAQVFIPADVTAISSSDIRDRRITSDVAFETFTAYTAQVLGGLTVDGTTDLNDTLNVQGQATFQSGLTVQGLLDIAGSNAELDDDQKVLLGSDGDYSIRYDSAGDDFILRDETNATDLLVLPKNTPINQILESGGQFELSVQGLSGDLADAQDPKSHASSHSDGGADELDAADLSGAKGSADQVLTSDGQAATWSGISVNSEEWKFIDTRTATGTTPSETFDVSGVSYKEYEVRFEYEETAGNFGSIYLLPNNNSSNDYRVYGIAGTTASSAQDSQGYNMGTVRDAGDQIGGKYQITESDGDNFHFTADMGAIGENETWFYGVYFGTHSPPIDTLDVETSDTCSGDYEIHLYGRNWSN